MIFLNFAKSTHINLEFVEIYVYITLQVSLNLGQQSVLQKLWNILLLRLEILRVGFFFHLSLNLIYYLFRGLVRLFRSFDRHVFFLFCEFAVQSRFNKKFSLLHQFFERYENLSQIKLYLATKQKLVFILFFPSFQSIFKFIFSNKQILCE